jgi:hypothetical protein
LNHYYRVVDLGFDDTLPQRVDNQILVWNGNGQITVDFILCPLLRKTIY